MNKQSVYEVFRRLARDLKINGDWSPHQWRHRFARKLLANGANLQQVSQLLGHESITVTSSFYGRLASNQIEEAYHRYYTEKENLDDLSGKD